MPPRVPWAEGTKQTKRLLTISLFPNFNIFIFKLKRKEKGPCNCLFPKDSEEVSTPPEISENNWPFTTGWWPQTWGQVNLFLQSPTVPLTSRWVHWRESQDAPVIGIEWIRCIPQPADMVGTTPSYDSFQHSSNRCAWGLSFWETAYGVQALDTWMCFSKLCLFCTCRMKVSIKHFFHNVNE